MSLNFKLKFIFIFFIFLIEIFHFLILKNCMILVIYFLIKTFNYLFFN